MIALSLKRLKLTFNKEIRENWRQLIMQFSVMLGCMCFIAILSIINVRYKYAMDPAPVYDMDYMDPMWPHLCDMFTWCLFIFGAISASMTLGNMGSRENRLASLMYPASQIEKYIVRWSIYVPGFIIAFTICCILTDLFRYLVTLALVPEFHTPVALFIPSCHNYISYYATPSELQGFIACFIFVQSLYVLGSSVWARHSLVKTFISGTVIAIAYSLIAYWVTELCLPDYYFVDDLSDSTNVLKLIWIASITGTLVNYILAFFRFRENEIITHW